MRVLTLLFVLFFTVPVFGDIILLKNGRTVRGQVVSISKNRVSIRIPGGTIEFSRSLIDKITRQSTKAEQIAKQFEKVKTDPKALDELSLEASSAGLHSQSLDIKELANGLRLEKRLEAIRHSKKAEDYIELFHWTQLAGYSLTVQKFVIEKALLLDPRNGLARLAKKQILAEELRAQLEAKKKKERKERAPKRVSRPKILPPKPKSPVKKQSKESIDKARIQAKKELEELRRLRSLLSKERQALEKEQAELERRRRIQRARARGRYRKRRR